LVFPPIFYPIHRIMSFPSTLTTAVFALTFLLLFPGSFLQAGESLPIPEEQQVIEQSLGEITLKPLTWEKTKGRKDDKPLGSRQLVFKGEESGMLAATVDDATGRVVTIETQGAPLTNEELRSYASTLSELRSLSLGHWGEWKYKETLKIEDFSGEGLDAFAGLQLEKLFAGGTRLNDEGLRAVAKLHQLKRLHIRHAAITKEGLKALIGHPGLVELKIEDSLKGETVTAEVIPTLLQIPHLEVLSLGQTYLPYQNGLDQFKQIADRLKELNLSNMAILPEDLEKLKADLPNTEVTFSHPFRRPYDKYLEERMGKWVPAEVWEQLKTAYEE